MLLENLLSYGLYVLSSDSESMQFLTVTAIKSSNIYNIIVNIGSSQAYSRFILKKDKFLWKISPIILKGK